MDIEFSAAIDSVKVKVNNAGGHVIRTCEMKFSRAFDDMIAAGLRGEARHALEALRSHGMEQVVLPLDAVSAQGTLVGGNDSRVIVPHMIGVKATCKANDISPPSIELTFSALWSEDVWVFLGRYAGAYVEITLTERQLSMPLTTPTEAKGGGGRA